LINLFRFNDPDVVKTLPLPASEMVDKLITTFHRHGICNDADSNALVLDAGDRVRRLPVGSFPNELQGFRSSVQKYLDEQQREMQAAEAKARIAEANFKDQVFDILTAELDQDDIPVDPAEVRKLADEFQKRSRRRQ
jgi:hypothetical protein